MPISPVDKLAELWNPLLPAGTEIRRRSVGGRDMGMGVFGKVRRRMGLAVPLVLVGAFAMPPGTWAAAAAGQPSPSQSVGQRATPTTVAPADQVAARATARQTGQRVEVTSQTTETTRLFAEPTGTMTLELHSTPVRVRRGPGWASIDTTLRMGPDATIRPAVTLPDLAFSSGGSGPFARLSHNGLELDLGWPSPPGSPTIAGNTATYAGVMPGVDLKVQAIPEGFSELLVVKSHQAALNPALGRVRFTVNTRGLSLSSSASGLTARDSSG